MQRIKSKKLLAALLLVGVCCLGGFLLKNAIGVDLDVEYIKEGIDENADLHDFYFVNDNIDPQGSASISVYAARYEDDGDDEGENLDYLSGVYIGGHAFLNEDEQLVVWAWASSDIHYERTGRANAWIKFPHETRINHNPNDPGDADIGKGHEKLSVEVDDFRIFDAHPWGRVMASAAVSAPGGRIKIGYEARIVL